MRRTVVVLVVLSLLAALGGEATAKKKKKKKKPAPVTTTYYMHGDYPLGEINGAQWVAEGFGSSGVMQMDATEPSESSSKSMFYTLVGFNDQCSGLPLFPTWVGTLEGTIVGDAKLTLHSVGAPGTAMARIWVDTPIFSCNDAYIAPAQEVEFDVPPGQATIEVTFEGLNLPATTSIMIEVLANPSTHGEVGRVLYDSTAAPTNITFECVPAAGSSCTP